MRPFKKIALTVLALIGGAPIAMSAWAGEPSLLARTAEEAAIVKLVAARQMSWNKHDPKASIQLFSEDATVITPMGRAVKGKPALEALFTEPGPTKTSTAKLTVDSIQWLAADTALVDGTQETVGMTGPDGKLMGAITMHVAAVVQKVGGAWLFAAVRPYAFVKVVPPPLAKPAAK